MISWTPPRVRKDATPAWTLLRCWSLSAPLHTEVHNEIIEASREFWRKITKGFGYLYNINNQMGSDQVQSTTSTWERDEIQGMFWRIHESFATEKVPNVLEQTGKLVVWRLWAVDQAGHARLCWGNCTMVCWWWCGCQVVHKIQSKLM